ncbi:ribosome biogenesis GTPase YlqF [Parageobacillus thermoglucosidasius]|uniref:Ribosome biogenesis GTPase A n=2 Tax=Parageobacillus thermoglucosidasius TaxID=1426 RepID=A0AB38R023_PARTM|nr:ribosome biogenesis GTPase YlqF [Parageobacillus thermoglucosidasius]UOE77396.1 ribosome biogenesis GTPase YlqF [Parageobacillus thermoglucosidasius]GCD83370.1 ribosome biogenesis GTPase A [Parageobacillus thermoglucosidasius]
MTIQWFPGHMAKAKREVQEKLKLIDIVFELLDARIPMASRNPMINEILGNKPRIVLLNKADMADEAATQQWIAYFQQQQLRALAIDAQTGTGIKQIVAVSKEMLKDKFAKMAAKGIKNPRPMRALIVGIPNVGKSTLINRLAGRNIAKTGDKPGVTKAQQWIKVGKEMELLDTPGILWPKFEEEEVGLKLATTGAIKDTILNLQDVAVYALNFLKRHYPERLKERYSLDDIPEEIAELFAAIGRRRGCLVSGGAVDYDKVAEIVLHDIRTERLGRISFETP